MNTQHPLSSARAARSALTTYLSQHSNGSSPPEICSKHLVKTIRYLYALEVHQTQRLDLARSLLDAAVLSFERGELETPKELVVAQELLQASLLQSSDAEVESSLHPKLDGSALQVQIDERSQSNFYTDISGNISEGGVFVPQESPLPIGTAVRLLICVEGRSDIQTQGRVAWVRNTRETGQPGMGVRFEELGSHEHETILHFLSKREPLLQV